MCRDGPNRYRRDLLVPNSEILKTKMPSHLKGRQFDNVSGWQDSNLRPPGPKPGAITGLRYIPNICISII